MQKDLLEAWHVARWAETHIPTLQENFISWQRGRPYEFVMEPDPNNPAHEFLVAYQKTPLRESVLGDVGAIINSTRTALDILMFTVLSRHRKKPKGNTHFPIFSEAADFLSRIAVLESKKWISSAEAAAIKRTKAYRGGDHFLYPLHQLDILRKHTRLLVLEPKIEAAQLNVASAAAYACHRFMQDKTILYRLPAGRVRPTPGNTLLTCEIFFNEPTLLKTSQPAIGVLRNFVFRVRALIENFP